MGRPNCCRPCGVADGLVQGRLGDADRAGGDAEAPGVERGEGDREALTLLADPARVGDPDAVEVELGGGRALHPHLLLGGGGFEPFGVAGHQERGDPAGALDSGAGQDRVEVGHAAVGDPRLGAGDDPVVAVPYGLRTERGGIGARGGLGETVGAQQAPSQHRREVLGPLLLGAVTGDRVAGEGVDADSEADGEPGGRELFEDL